MSSALISRITLRNLLPKPAVMAPSRNYSKKGSKDDEGGRSMPPDLKCDPPYKITGERVSVPECDIQKSAKKPSKLMATLEKLLPKKKVDPFPQELSGQLGKIMEVNKEKSGDTKVEGTGIIPEKAEDLKKEKTLNTSEGTKESALKKFMGMPGEQQVAGKDEKDVKSAEVREKEILTKIIDLEPEKETDKPGLLAKIDDMAKKDDLLNVDNLVKSESIAEKGEVGKMEQTSKMEDKDGLTTEGVTKTDVTKDEQHMNLISKADVDKAGDSTKMYDTATILSKIDKVEDAKVNIVEESQLSAKVEEMRKVELPKTDISTKREGVPIVDLMKKEEVEDDYVLKRKDKKNVYLAETTNILSDEKVTANVMVAAKEMVPESELLIDKEKAREMNRIIEDAKSAANAKMEEIPSEKITQTVEMRTKDGETVEEIFEAEQPKKVESLLNMKGFRDSIETAGKLPSMPSIPAFDPKGIVNLIKDVCKSASASGPSSPPPNIPEEGFKRPVRRELPGKVILVVVPIEWQEFLYPKTGQTGLYTLFFTVGTFLISKEYYVLEHEYYVGLSTILLWYVFTDKFGPPLRAELDQFVDEYENAWESGRKNEEKVLNEMITANTQMQSDIEANLEIVKAKREVVWIQQDCEYRQRLMQVYTKVKKQLDYQLTKKIPDSVLLKNMIEYITTGVIKEMTPEWKQRYLSEALDILNQAAGKPST